MIDDVNVRAPELAPLTILHAALDISAAAVIRERPAAAEVYMRRASVPDVFGSLIVSHARELGRLITAYRGAVDEELRKEREQWEEVLLRLAHARTKTAAHAAVFALSPLHLSSTWWTNLPLRLATACELRGTTALRQRERQHQRLGQPQLNSSGREPNGVWGRAPAQLLPG